MARPFEILSVFVQEKMANQVTDKLPSSFELPTLPEQPQVQDHPTFPEQSHAQLPEAFSIHSHLPDFGV
jgi:hypothetical protein